METSLFSHFLFDRLLWQSRWQQWYSSHPRSWEMIVMKSGQGKQIWVLILRQCCHFCQAYLYIHGDLEFEASRRSLGGRVCCTLKAERESSCFLYLCVDPIHTMPSFTFLNPHLIYSIPATFPSLRSPQSLALPPLSPRRTPISSPKKEQASQWHQPNME